MNLNGSQQRTLGLALLGTGLALPFVVGLAAGPLSALRFILPLPVLWLGASRTLRLMRASWPENVAWTDGPVFLLSVLLFGLAFVVSYPIARFSGALDPGSNATAVSVFPTDVLLFWAGALFLIGVAPDQE